MTSSWAQFEATLRRELGRNNQCERETQETPSASSVLRKDDIFLFGSGSLSNLVVVNCHICGALTKPAFLKHHITKLHGASRIDLDPPVKPLISNKDVERTKLLDPGPCQRSSIPKEPPPIKMTLRCPPVAPPPAAPAKAKGRKQSKNKKPSKKKEDKKDLRGLLGSQAFSDKSGKRKLHLSNNDIKTEVGESSKMCNGVFDLKHLLNRLPTTNPNSAYHKPSAQEKRERSNGMLYQRGPVKPLSACRHGRSAGNGQVLFTRQYDNLIAGFSSLFSNRPQHRCTSELRTPDGGVPTLSSIVDLDRSESPDKLSDRLSDVIDPDLLDDKNFLLPEGLYDNFLWSDYMDTKPPKHLSTPNSASSTPRASVPKLKVNSSQIKSKSAMAVFEFEDNMMGDGRGRCKLNNDSLQQDGKGKRKLIKSPSSSTSSQQGGSVPGNSLKCSPAESPTQNSKRSRYEVIELDNTPSPERPLPQLSSPRQFSYMMGYSEQSAT